MLHLNAVNEAFKTMKWFGKPYGKIANDPWSRRHYGGLVQLIHMQHLRPRFIHLSGACFSLQRKPQAMEVIMIQNLYRVSANRIKINEVVSANNISLYNLAFSVSSSQLNSMNRKLGFYSSDQFPKHGEELLGNGLGEGLHGLLNPVTRHCLSFTD